MIFHPLKLEGSFLIDLEKRADDRGFFARYYCEDEYKNFNLDTNIVQINTSVSKQKGTLRGLHFQHPPNSETKIVRCLNGAIWDVIVDLRDGSRTYGQWHAEELSSENKSMMYVPKGFAHGFVSLTDDVEILYLVTNFYSPKNEDTLLWSDNNLAIKWPITPIVINSKDANAKKLSEIVPLKV